MDLKGEMARMQGYLLAETYRVKSDVLRQLYIAILAQMAVYLGIAYFFVTQILPRT